jgi:hypothetical protein
MTIINCRRRSIPAPSGAFGMAGVRGAGRGSMRGTLRFFLTGCPTRGTVD